MYKEILTGVARDASSLAWRIGTKPVRLMMGIPFTAGQIISRQREMAEAEAENQQIATHTAIGRLVIASCQGKTAVDAQEITQIFAEISNERPRISYDDAFDPREAKVLRHIVGQKDAAAIPQPREAAIEFLSPDVKLSAD